MDPDTNGPGDALKSTLDELAHLVIDPSRLTIPENSEIGSGGYGEVCLATLDGSSKVAIKLLRVIHARGTRVRVAMRLARELKVWEKAKHPNVLKLIGYYLSENYASAQLISPYMENGNITEYIKRTQPSIEKRLGFVRGITLGMAYLHRCDPSICHGDLKPANVLIDEKLDVVLCDFGLATFVQYSGAASGLTTSRSTKGSTRYMSPELFLDSEAKHTLESDIWGWACTVFEIMTDNTPYAAALSDASIVVAIVQGASPGSIELLSHLVPAVHGHSLTELIILKNLIPECWNKEARKRPSCPSIVERLEYVDPTLPSNDKKKYCQMDLRSRNGKVWISEAMTKPGLVLPLQDEVVDRRMSVAPNGKWLAARSDAEVSMLWNLENLSAPPLLLPEECDKFAWSPDSQHLACLGFKELSIWSIRTQSSYGCCKSWVFSAAWFSDGDGLVVLDYGSVHVMRSESGEFRMGPSLLKIQYESACFPMATFSRDCVGGRRVVVISNCGQRNGDASLIKVVSQNGTHRETAHLTMIVFDIEAQRILARIPQKDTASALAISKNGEFVIVSHKEDFPMLMQLEAPPSGHVIRCVALTYPDFTVNPKSFVGRDKIYRSHFGGDNDEWVISTTAEGDIITWEVGSSQPCQVVKTPPSIGANYNPMTVYCPGDEKSGPVVLLYGHSDQEVIVWKWWNKPSKQIDVATPPSGKGSMFRSFASWIRGRSDNRRKLSGVPRPV